MNEEPDIFLAAGEQRSGQGEVTNASAMYGSHNLMSMGENAQGIAQATDRLLELVANPEDPSDARQAVRLFCENTAQSLLDWMATGKTAEARSLLDAWRVTLGPDQAASRCLEPLTLFQRLVVHVQVLSWLMTTYLRTDNLSLLLGQLSGRRYQRWVRTLDAIASSSSPMRVADLTAREIFGTRSAANHALLELARLGLLVRVDNGEQHNAAYVLSWSGQRVCQARRDPVAGEGAQCPESAGIPEGADATDDGRLATSAAQVQKIIISVAERGARADSVRLSDEECQTLVGVRLDQERIEDMPGCVTVANDNRSVVLKIVPALDADPSSLPRNLRTCITVMRGLCAKNPTRREWKSELRPLQCA